MVGICSQAGVAINGFRALDRAKQAQADEVKKFQEKHETVVREITREADTVLGMTNDFADFSYRSIRSLLATGLKIKAKSKQARRANQMPAPPQQEEQLNLLASDGNGNSTSSGGQSPKKRTTFADDVARGEDVGVKLEGVRAGGGGRVAKGGLENDLELDANHTDDSSIERLTSSRAKDLRHVVNMAKKFTVKMLQCDMCDVIFPEELDGDETFEPSVEDAIRESLRTGKAVVTSQALSGKMEGQESNIMVLPIWHRNTEGEDDGGVVPHNGGDFEGDFGGRGSGSDGGQPSPKKVTSVSSLFPTYHKEHSQSQSQSQSLASQSSDGGLQLPRPRGVVYVIRHRDHEPFTRRDQDLLSRIGSFVGLATYTHAATDATVRELKQRRESLHAATRSLELGNSQSSQAEEQARLLVAVQQAAIKLAAVKDTSQLFNACEQVSHAFPHTRISSLYLVDHEQNNLYRVLEFDQDHSSTIGVTEAQHGGGSSNEHHNIKVITYHRYPVPTPPPPPPPP